MRNDADNVVKLRGRWHLGVELVGGADQRRISLDAHGLEKRLEERMLVLAVAVSVVEDIHGGVRLVTANPERQADISKLG